MLERFQTLALTARRLDADSFISCPRKRLPAGGTEATSLRDYMPGDDIRYVDWQGCARSDEILTKVFESEVTPSVYIMLDCSTSMGHLGGGKSRLARRISAALAYQAAFENLPVTVTTFADRALRASTPIRRKEDFGHVLRFLSEAIPDQGETNLKAAAEGFARAWQRPGPVILISDLLDEAGCRPCCEVLKRFGFLPRVVHLFDPNEGEPRMRGDREMQAVETSERWEVTVTDKMLKRYKTLYREMLDESQEYCTLRATKYIRAEVGTSEDLLFRKVMCGF